MIRKALLLVLAAALLGVPVVQAGERCPLDIQTCLQAFAAMRDRPWLGVEIDADCTGAERVVRVAENSPARRAGIRAGDVLETVQGKPLRQWFAGKSGWDFAEHAPCTVSRGGHEKRLDIALERIPEDALDRMIGQHMLEQHLASAGTPEVQQH